MGDKLDLVGKLLMQAEHAGTPEEAETFMAAAQKIAARNSVDLAMALAHQQDRAKRQVPEKRTVRIAPPGEWRQSSTTKYLVELFLAVAQANDVTVHIGGTGRVVFPHGFPGDLDVTEALYAALAVQMVTQADAALKRGDHKALKRVPKVRRTVVEGYWSTGRKEYQEETVRNADGTPVMVERMVPLVDGRVFRANFYDGFVARIQGRLWEAKREEQRAMGVRRDGTEEQGLALRSKALEVQEFIAAELGDRKLGVYRSPEVATFSAHGQDAGQAAGASANLATAGTAVGDGRRTALPSA